MHCLQSEYFICYGNLVELNYSLRVMLGIFDSNSVPHGGDLFCVSVAAWQTCVADAFTCIAFSSAFLRVLVAAMLVLGHELLTKLFLHVWSQEELPSSVSWAGLEARHHDTCRHGMQAHKSERRMLQLMMLISF